MPQALLLNQNGRPYEEIWGAMCFSKHTQSQPINPSPIHTCTELNKSLPPLVPSLVGKKTHIMSILNLTPDSFSDGGHHVWNNENYLRSIILSHLRSGATIIDLGGQSSRPGAPDISASEEISRLTPALNILSSLRQDPNITPFATSVDTYRASVAEAAVNAGADIINDISAGTLDPDMLPTVARLGCTYILMHMRGTPHTMTSKENTTYDGDLIATIESELIERLAAAEEAGIRRWRMILDPGIGFAKTAPQNLEILRRLTELGSANGRIVNGAYRNLADMPWLVGSSRKGFVGKATGVKNASERTWGTAATVVAAVQGGADIVRVHDVEEMRQVVRMSEAIWRGGQGRTATRDKP
jgi:2-amino-4-hydroxy-6-hydroxymethyldihydropteridine diphosphokinase/dihydropteroate synthase